MQQNNQTSLTDEEDDQEYVPQINNEDESDEESRAHRVKRARISMDEDIVPQAIGEELKGQDAQLWADFLSSVSTPTQSGPTPKPTNTVKIEQRHRFAGADIVELKDVPEDSEEAKKWPRWVNPSSSLIAEDLLNNAGTWSPGNNTIPVSGPPSTKESTKEPSVGHPKPTKRPGPRKSKIILGQPTLAQAQARKVSTLDKSAMDWNTYVHSRDSVGEKVQDTLAINRRGGGFLEKQDFLERVEERKNDVLEASKGKRRRE